LGYQAKPTKTLRRFDMGRSAEDLAKIAAAGGGLVLDAENLSKEDMIDIAKASDRGEVTVIFRNVGNKSTEELIEVAGATGEDGLVLFDL